MHPSDEAILDLFHLKEQREQAFEQLVRKYREPLYWLIRRIVHEHAAADDVLQNSFLKIWNALPNFRADAQLMTWMYRIATNEALKHIQKEQRLQALWSDAAGFQQQMQADPYFDADAVTRQLWAAIHQLPKQQKIIFILRYFEGLPFKAVPEILDVSEGSAKASYHHARQKMEHFLSAD
jgi:RNA polymerase sigma-70 factor (ECF subfamily)